MPNASADDCHCHRLASGCVAPHSGTERRPGEHHVRIQKRVELECRRSGEQQEHRSHGWMMMSARGRAVNKTQKRKGNSEPRATTSGLWPRARDQYPPLFACTTKTVLPLPVLSPAAAGGTTRPPSPAGCAALVSSRASSPPSVRLREPMRKQPVDEAVARVEMPPRVVPRVGVGARVHGHERRLGRLVRRKAVLVPVVLKVGGRTVEAQRLRAKVLSKFACPGSPRSRFASSPTPPHGQDRT